MNKTGGFIVGWKLLTGEIFEIMIVQYSASGFSVAAVNRGLSKSARIASASHTSC